MKDESMDGGGASPPPRSASRERSRSPHSRRSPPPRDASPSLPSGINVGRVEPHSPPPPSVAVNPLPPSASPTMVPPAHHRLNGSPSPRTLIPNNNHLVQHHPPQMPPSAAASHALNHGQTVLPPQFEHLTRRTPEMKSEGEPEDELMLKWDAHHNSFFELAEELCHQELFIDVTLSCGEHNFPAHKLILSVCSPYFRFLFSRNPCKHPIVVLKDVDYKDMKLLLMYMYRGEVSCPQDELEGLLKTARSLQIRGLVELEAQRQTNGVLTTTTGTPIKSDVDRASNASYDSRARTPLPPSHHQGLPPQQPQPPQGSLSHQQFSLNEVRHRLQGQLEIQPVTSAAHGFGGQPPAINHSDWRSGHSSSSHPAAPRTVQDVISKAVATSSVHDPNRSDTGSEEDEHLRYQHHQRIKEDNLLRSQKWVENNGSDLNSHHLQQQQQQQPQQHHQPAHPRLASPLNPPPRSRSRPSSSNAAHAASNAAIMAAAQAAGMPTSALDPNDPMASMNALLAAAQQHSNASSTSSSVAAIAAAAAANNQLPPSTLASLTPSSSSSPSAAIPRPRSRSRSNATATPPTAAAVQAAQAALAAQAAANANGGNSGSQGGSNGNGVDITPNQLQLYYYMQKVASAGMGNPKERKECPICGKTLYDRSTWNRHMRIHTGEKPYPCTFCGRRFRTNYNKLGHEKKCPDRHARDLLNQQQGAGSEAGAAPPRQEAVGGSIR